MRDVGILVARADVLRAADGLAAAGFAAGGLLTGETGYLARSIGPGIVAAVAGLQVLLHREHALFTLGVAALVPAVQVKLYGVADTEVGAASTAPPASPETI